MSNLDSVELDSVGHSVEIGQRNGLGIQGRVIEIFRKWGVSKQENACGLWVKNRVWNTVGEFTTRVRVGLHLGNE